MHGISPTPELNMKFQSQAEDDINVNDFVKRCLGTAAVRRHKHYWYTGKRKYSSVAYCKYFRVSLCTDKCYEVFFSMWDIGSQKENMKVEMEQNQQDTSTYLRCIKCQN